MKIIQNNPFRILGIISNASAKETKESETFILRYLDIGKSADLKFDITPPLNYLQRNTVMIESAKRNIHDDFDKLFHSIFWFVKKSKADQIALEKLSINKNIEKAAETFKKGVRKFVVSTASFTSIINYTTLEIINYVSHKNKERIIFAIKYKYKVIKDQTIFKEFEELITSTSNKINYISYKDRFFKNVKSLLNELFPDEDINKLLLDIFSDDNSLLKEIEEIFLNSLVEDLKKMLVVFDKFFSKYSNQTDAQIIISKSKILNSALQLFNDTKLDLNKLKKIVGKDNFKYTNLVDEIYSCVNSSVILCYNKEIKKSKIDTAPYIKLLEEILKEISTIDFPIKQTIVKNLSVIKNEESSLICQFCNSGKKADYSFKVEMHKMNGYDQYTYFKGGGLQVSSCLKCFISRTTLKVITFLLSPLTWPIIIVIILLIRQYKSSWFSWLYWFLYKNLFGLSVRNHPKIKECINKGYKIGMP